MNLPPLPLPLPPALPPLPLAVPALPPLPLPPLGEIITSRPGQQTASPTGPDRVTTLGADWVQVMLNAPDDAYARVELIAAGVSLMPNSLVPTSGTIHIMPSTSGGKWVYRWRS